MSNLRSTIEDLSSQFAVRIIEALRGASIDELLAVAGGDLTSGRRPAARPRATGNEGGGSSGGNARESAGAGRRRGRGGRLGRRSPDDIARMVEDITSLLAKSNEGLRAEQIREALGVEAKELPRPLAEALSSGRITKSGQKRATTYFVGSGEGGSSSAGGRRRGGGGGGRGRGKKRGG